MPNNAADLVPLPGQLDVDEVLALVKGERGAAAAPPSSRVSG